MTGVISALEPIAPILSLGVLYLFAVLPVAVLWGLAYALPVSVASMLAFNWFFLPPRHTFELSDSDRSAMPFAPPARQPARQSGSGQTRCPAR